jgi:hypothetical protein
MNIIEQLLKNSIGMVDNETADKIIETRKPKGSFITIEDDKIIAISNESGDAFTEEFQNMDVACQWLHGDLDTEEAYKLDKQINTEKESLTVSRLVYMLRQINGFWEVKKENGMPVERITIELDNEGKPYVKIC